MSVSSSFYLSCCSRWFIKHPVIIKHSLIVCERVCLCAGVSPGNYLMLRSLMTTQTNICPKVMYKNERLAICWACCVCACMHVRVYDNLCVTRNIHLMPECALCAPRDQNVKSTEAALAALVITDKLLPNTLSPHKTLQTCSHTPTQSSRRSARPHRHP